MQIEVRMENGALRGDVSDRIRTKIGLGLLPVATNPFMRTWVGKGTGRLCDACDRPIAEADVECEADVPGDQTSLRFHRPCLIAWQQARASE
jgi:hypothetical protein